MREPHSYQTEIAIIGGGLAGLVTAFELLNHHKKVLVIERGTSAALGGLARISTGGVTMINTPEQRRAKIYDSPELALRDWHSIAGFGKEDHWPKCWAETYVHQSDPDIYRWLKARGITFVPVIAWPERGLFAPGNSVPRWHITWGTGKQMMARIIHDLNHHPQRSNLNLLFNHRVDSLDYRGGQLCGCSGALEQGPDRFQVQAEVVVIAAGGICGGDMSYLRKHWFGPWGAPPTTLLNGSHPFADGTLHEAVRHIGGQVTHLDRQYHYAAGIHHPNPDLPNRGISVIPPRSALWLDPLGRRIGPVPLMGGTDTRYLVEKITQLPGGYSWLVLNWKIAVKELAISENEFMDSLRDRKTFRLVLESFRGNPTLVQRLLDDCKDIVSGADVGHLVQQMNALQGQDLIQTDVLAKTIADYDRHLDHKGRFANDYQIRRIRDFRSYRADRLKVSKFQKIADPKAGPLLAIRAFILTRKSLGGIQTDLGCRVLNTQGLEIPGLFAVGEAAGFGGGGIHGKTSLEGTFLGACILTGRLAARAIAG